MTNRRAGSDCDDRGQGGSYNQFVASIESSPNLGEMVQVFSGS